MWMTVHAQRHSVSQVLLFATLRLVWYHPTLLQQEANQNCFSLLHRLFLLLIYLNWISSSSQSTCLKYVLQGKVAGLWQTLDPLVSTLDPPVKFPPLCCSPSGMSQWRTVSTSRSPSLLYLCGRDWSSAAGADMNIWTNQLRETDFYKCLHIHLSWSVFALNLFFELYLGTSFYTW